MTFGVPFSPSVASVSWATTALPAGVNMGQLVMDYQASFIQSAGVLQTGADSIVAGFSLPFSTPPSSIDGFTARFAITNVTGFSSGGGCRT